MALPELLMRPHPRVLVVDVGGAHVCCRSCLDLIATTVSGSTSPSILSADFLRLGAQVSDALEAGCAASTSTSWTDTSSPT